MSPRHHAVLTDDAIVVRSLPGGAVLVRHALTGPRRVVAAADGGFVALGSDATLRLEPRAFAPERFGRISLFPDSMVFADRRDGLTLWVAHGRGALYRYGLDERAAAARLVAPATHEELPDFDEQALTALPDGSFLYTAGAELQRFFPAGKRTKGPRPAPERELWRLLPTRRIDQVWAAHGDATFELCQVAPAMAKVRSLDLGGEAFDVASCDTSLALVRVELGEPGRRWWVEAFDERGRKTLSAALPPEPPPTSADWVELATRDRELVCARGKPWLAVGGPTWLAVWRLDDGTPVLHPGRADGR